MSERSAGKRQRAYADPSRTNKRRIITGSVLVTLIGANELPLRLLDAVHHHPIMRGAILLGAGVLGADYVVEGLVKLKRLISGRVIVFDFGPSDQAPRE